jgi:hypothetical protein
VLEPAAGREAFRIDNIPPMPVIPATAAYADNADNCAHNSDVPATTTPSCFFRERHGGQTPHEAGAAVIPSWFLSRACMV